MVGEELGVLPGMDSIFTVLELERLVGFFVNAIQRNGDRDKFDVVVYDGISTEETIRMIGATSKARLVVCYFPTRSSPFFPFTCLYLFVIVHYTDYT